MLNDEICKLREKLNNSIINGEDYDVTYKLSVELDELIAEYYRMELKITQRYKLKEGYRSILLFVTKILQKYYFFVIYSQNE